MSAASVLDTRRIGWIGLGKMGLPICERLVAQGFEVATLTRNPEGRERATRANLHCPMPLAPRSGRNMRLRS